MRAITDITNVSEPEHDRRISHECKHMDGGFGRAGVDLEDKRWIASVYQSYGQIGDCSGHIWNVIYCPWCGVKLPDPETVEEKSKTKLAKQWIVEGE